MAGRKSIFGKWKPNPHGHESGPTGPIVPPSSPDTPVSPPVDVKTIADGLQDCDGPTPLVESLSDMAAGLGVDEPDFTNPPYTDPFTGVGLDQYLPGQSTDKFINPLNTGYSPIPNSLSDGLEALDDDQDGEGG